jgi:hypothetical protein
MTAKSWPEPIAEAAFIGPVGEYVRAIAPESEGDPAAILAQTLVAFGNAAGRHPHFTIEDTTHHTNLNAVIVGKTASARKGTSLGRAFGLVAAADLDWGERNAGDGGLSSSEGLIRAVHDDPTDPHADKRLLAVMGEFGETLEKMSRDGNTLSATLRQAWDGSTLRVRTRSDPLKATGAHVSVIGHITEADLKEQLTAASIGNGFANRFLWVAARRSRELPLGSQVTVSQYPEAIAAVRASIEWAHEKPREIKMSGKLTSRWTKLYSALAYDDDPLAAILDRAAPQIRRLALIYAVSERATQIEHRHLNAAEAVWAYAEASVRYVFSDARKPGLTGQIEQLLAAGEWVAKGDITFAVKGKYKAVQVGQTLAAMLSAKQIVSREVAGAGRPRTEYRLR